MDFPFFDDGDDYQIHLFLLQQTKISTPSGKIQEHNKF